MAIPQPERGDWLRANAQELRATDREILAMLRATKKRVDAILRELPAGQQEIRRAQLEGTRARLLAEQSALFERMGDVVSARRAKAASRAARLSAAADAALLSLVGKSAQAQYLYESALEVSQRAIDVALQRMKFSALPLSQRIYNTSVWMNGRLGKLINETLASGLNAREFARRARDWFNPNTPGGVRYAAMRLARTEINNAFHSISAQKYAETPWITNVDWNLSGSHVKKDLCDKYAEESPYKSDETPARPHPQCMCNITPVSIDEDEFVENFLKGDYDDYLDAELEKNGWNEPEQSESAAEAGTTLRAPVEEVRLPVVPLVQEPLTGKAAHDVVPKGLFKRGSLTPEQRKAVQTYESGWFVVINGFLREERWGNPDDWREERDVNLIDSAMEASVLPQPIQTWRGMFRAKSLFGDRLDNDLTGFSWHEKGYGSTTSDRKVTELFNMADERQDPQYAGQNVVAKVFVAAGVRALEISTSEKGSPANGPQAEIALGRNTKWTVTKDGGYVNGVREIEVTVDLIS